MSNKMVAAGLIADLANLGAIVTWRQTKGVYRIDPTMFDALWNTPLDGDLPSSVFFHLPEWCVWIETPQQQDEFSSRGFFAYLEYDLKTGRPELRIALDVEGRGRHSLINHGIYLTEKTVPSALQAFYDRSYQNAVAAGFVNQTAGLEHGLDAIVSGMTELIAPRLSLLIYLCSVNAEITDRRGSGRRPGRPAPKKTKRALKEIAASAPTHWDVGVRLGAALRAAAERQETAAASGTHASPRPHIRRAHWHSFWTGPRTGKRQIRVKWLPPIPVKVEDASDLVATVRDVSD